MQNEIALNGRDIQLDIRFPRISINYVIVIKAPMIRKEHKKAWMCYIWTLEPSGGRHFKHIHDYHEY